MLLNQFDNALMFFDARTERGQVRVRERGERGYVHRSPKARDLPIKKRLRSSIDV
jgi:hypothetical protein